MQTIIRDFIQSRRFIFCAALFLMLGHLPAQEPAATAEPAAPQPAAAPAENREQPVATPATLSSDAAGQASTEDTKTANIHIHHAKPKYTHEQTGTGDQYSAFPRPLNQYHDSNLPLIEKLVNRVRMEPFNLAVTLIFFGAVLHTFLAGKFQRYSHELARRHKAKLAASGFRLEHPEQRIPVSFKSSIFHFLGEIEVVFGIWIIPFAFVCHEFYSFQDLKLYIDHDCSFTEPLFVAVIMIIASSRPIYRLAENTLKLGASLGKGSPAAWWLSVICLAPLLGSFITEPAAMTLAAILLAKKFYQLKPSKPLMYATLALLFVNISIGGTLSSFAAPPIVMVAEKWGWGMAHMIQHFGWKSLCAILISNIVYFFIFRKEFKRLHQVQRENSAFDDATPTSWEDRQDVIPIWVYIISLLFLAWTVYFAHSPAIFIGGFMFFIGFTIATPQYQNEFSIKVPMLVAFFLAGLVILGGTQGWWLEPLLQSLGDSATMAGATILTAFNDNAAVTYLASTVPDLTDNIKYSVVAGAVTGGGLTVIANAPNPAGQAILGKFFKGINPVWLFLWALFPTAIVYIFFTAFGH